MTSPGDTLWMEYARASAQSCNYNLVPSVLTDPIMSAATFSMWIDSNAIVLADTQDSCVVSVKNSGQTMQYSVDMQRGVVTMLYVSGPAGAAIHTYLYGYDKGLYYLRRVCFGYDTIIENGGGYNFYNIRINGSQITSIRKKRNPEYRDIKISPGVNLLGRRLFSVNMLYSRPFSRFNNVTQSDGFPSGYYVFPSMEKGKVIIKP